MGGRDRVPGVWTISQRDHGSRASYDGSRGSQHQAPAGLDIKRSLCAG